MERTVPDTGSESIELYIRTYYSLLRSSSEVSIKALEEMHTGIQSSLHPGAHSNTPDIAALTYAALRLPACMPDVRLVLLGQTSSVFARRGYPEVESWQKVEAPGRRRLMYYDGDETLAVYIASRSDIDDIIPIMTAYQIEWNKLNTAIRTHGQLASFIDERAEVIAALSEEERDVLASALGIQSPEVKRLAQIWGDTLLRILQQVGRTRKKMAVKQLAGSLADYHKATQNWWTHLRSELPPGMDLANRPVYFVSSNLHSIANLCSGFALAHKDNLLAHIENTGQENLLAEYRDIEAEQVPSSIENFFYYTLSQFLKSGHEGAQTMAQDRLDYERTHGIYRTYSRHTFDVNAQAIELSALDPSTIDPRLCLSDIEHLKASRAVILNIDYPLGMAAYLLLSQIARSVEDLLGVYVMGKAATLNGSIGDVMIPLVVHDEHSSNTYLFENCFRAEDVAPHLTYNIVLDNQKAVTVPGTFLQNKTYTGVFYREGYTDIEMEAGPYLSAIYESVRPIRHPTNEIVDLHHSPFEIGFLHYASDMPLRQGKTLAAGSLLYRGVDSTYAVSIAIMRRIIAREIEAVKSRQQVTQG